MQSDMGIKAKKHRTGLWVLLSVVGACVLLVVVAVIWYMMALRPVDANNAEKQRFDVSDGSSTDKIANQLKSDGFIRSSLAYTIYTKLHGYTIQAGIHMLSPSYSTQEIADKLSSAETDEISVTIPPGLTLDELRAVFKKYGFSDEEISAAYSKNYDHPLLADKPASADLEGYIFPDTYRINATDSLDVLIEKSLDNLYDKLQQSGDIDKFKNNNLTIFEAITLASIVQKEVSNPDDQVMVAGVFLNRLKDDQWLGSDVTYMYAAKKLGVTASPSLDSPYNTRMYRGLPPGPIANMNYSALDAVANPAQTDYYYFVAGDDGTTHYATTEAEHLQNVEKYCTKLCQ